MKQAKKTRPEASVHALVLSGCGSSSTAAYEVGAMKALAEGGCAHLDGIHLDPAIYSCSAFGAFNAAIMASQIGGDMASTLSYLERVWLEDLSSTPTSCGNGVYRLRGNPLNLLDPRCYLSQPGKPLIDAFNDFVFLSTDFLKRLRTFLDGESPLVERLLHIPDMTAFFDMQPLQSQLRKHIDLERLRSSEKELLVIATDWARGMPRAFTKQEITGEQGYAILQASAAFLLAFPFVDIDGRPFGGAPGSMATPLKPVMEIYGSQIRHLVIHVIYLLPPMKDVPISKMTSLLDGLGRSFSMNEIVNIHAEVEYASTSNNPGTRASGNGETLEVDGETNENHITIHRYRPRRSPVNWFEFADFDRQKTEEHIAQGYDETLAHDCKSEGCILAT